MNKMVSLSLALLASVPSVSQMRGQNDTRDVKLAEARAALVWLQAAQGKGGGSPSPWLIEYTETGGIDGRYLHITLESSGRVSATGRHGQSAFGASAKQLSEAMRLVEGLKLSGGPSRSPSAGIADALYTTVEVTRAGRKYSVDSLPGALFQILQSLMKEGDERAEVETWRKAGAFRLGRVWHVREEMRDPNGMFTGQLDGTWTRRGQTPVFDAVWRSETGRTVRDTVEVETAARGRVVLRRLKTKRRYEASYWPDRQHELVGSVSSCPECKWFADIEY